MILGKFLIRIGQKFDIRRASETNVFGVVGCDGSVLTKTPPHASADRAICGNARWLRSVGQIFPWVAGGMRISEQGVRKVAMCIGLHMCGNVVESWAFVAERDCLCCDFKPLVHVSS